MNFVSVKNLLHWIRDIYINPPFTDQGQNSHLSIQGEGISAKNRQLFTKLILLKWFRCGKLTLLVLHYYIFGFK